MPGGNALDSDDFCTTAQGQGIEQMRPGSGQMRPTRVVSPVRA